MKRKENNKDKLEKYQSTYNKSDKGKSVRKNYRENNHDHLLEKSRKWKINNPEKIHKYNEQSKGYKDNNYPTILEKSRQYESSHGEERKAKDKLYNLSERSKETRLN